MNRATKGNLSFMYSCLWYHNFGSTFWEIFDFVFLAVPPLYISMR